MRQYIDGRAMDDVAIERLRTFESEALAMHENGYWLAFSGGKDSVVILDLAERAGVKFEAVHNLTTVDPPELVRFVKTFPQVRIDKPKETMWQLIRKNGMPPTSVCRYCCRVLKEKGGTGRIVVTGVRAAESARRSSRRIFESCYRDKTRHLLHPIFDWPTSAVWEYIRERGLRYCSLYDEGMSRVGCVLCPNEQNREKVIWQMSRWPRLAAAWKRTIDAVCTPGTWDWWIESRWAPRGKRKRQSTDNVLFEDNPELDGDE